MRARFPTSSIARLSRDTDVAVKSKKSIGPIRLTIVCAVVLSVFVVSGTALYIFDLRNRVLAGTEKNLANTSLIVAKQVEHIFATIEAVQQEFHEQINEYGIVDSEGFDRRLTLHDIHLKLRDKAAGMPYVGSLTAINSQGRVLNFSRQWPVPNIDASERGFFKAFHSDPNLLSYIGDPVRNYANGTWAVHLARKITGPKGEFLGLISAAVDLEYLQNIFSQIILDPGYGIGLIRNDGMVIARIPKLESSVGHRFPNALGLKLTENAIHGVGVSVGRMGDGARVIAAHRVGRFPIVIATSKTVTMALADWRQTTNYAALAATLIIFVIAAFVVLFIKLFRNYQALVSARAERENAQKLQEKSQQFDVALNNMSQGLAMFDASERIILCNRRYVEMYGLPPEAVAPGRTLRELLETRQALGSFPNNIENYRRELLNDISLGRTSSFVLADSAGRSYRIITEPMAGGGWVGTHEDVTDKMYAEKINELQKLQLDAALENMSQGLCMFDASQRLIVCNKQYTKLYGLSPEQTKPGTSLRTILDHRIAVGNAPDDHENYIKSRLNEVAINKSYQVTNRLSDGRYVSVVHRPMADGGWVATHQDVTEAKRREESFQLLFEGSPIPMWVINGETLRFLAVNDATLTHYGYSREQFLAMAVPDLRPAADRERFTAFLRALSTDQIADKIGQHVKADGTLIDIEVYSKSLIYDGQPARLTVIHDITQSKLGEDELRRTKKFIDAIIEHVPLPIIVKDVSGLKTDTRESKFTLFNRAYEELTGDSRTELIGKTAHQIYPKDRADLIVQSDNETLISDKVVLTSEHPIMTSKNGTRSVIAKKTVINNDDGKPQYLLTVIDDVTERRRAEARITYLAHYDSLTDLPNRASFVECLDATLNEAISTNEQFAVLCIDLDRFKEANDVHGHLVGDGLLRETARRLREVAADVFIARIGGDEFTIIVKSGAQPATSEALAAKLLDAFQRDFEVEGHRLQLSLSIGGAVYPTDGADAKTLMANADAALYQAKGEARGSVRFFAAELGARVRERRDIQNDLQLALTNGEFFLHYQPQNKIASNKTIGFETLVRWQCPKRGLVAPGLFIPLAEESRLIISLGEWILREACREAASWPQPLTVAVNISPIQFHHGDLPALVHSILLETGLKPSRLELEITEGVLIDDFSRAVSILRKLKSIGVQIAMDDFGSGYSSLSYLHSFPFDKIKIDRSFIGDLEHNHHSMAIVRAIITLGHSLGVPVLAEGVETGAQQLFLAQAGCDEVQGYFMGRPLPIAAYASLVGRVENLARRHVKAL